MFSCLCILVSGGIVFIGGIVGFLFSRNPANLIYGGVYGDALLALGILSLKVWGKGHSSLPFILGHAGTPNHLLVIPFPDESQCS